MDAQTKQDARRARYAPILMRSAKEAIDRAARIEAMLEALSIPPEPDLLREVHTQKGLGRTLGADDIAAAAEIIEHRLRAALCEQTIPSAMKDEMLVLARTLKDATEAFDPVAALDPFIMRHFSSD